MALQNKKMKKWYCIILKILLQYLKVGLQLYEDHEIGIKVRGDTKGSTRQSFPLGDPQQYQTAKFLVVLLLLL